MVTKLLLEQGKAVRAMIRNEDERALALRDMGARSWSAICSISIRCIGVIVGCEMMYFRHVGFGAYLAATVNAVAVAKHHGMKAFINMSQNDALTDEHYRNHREPVAQAALARRAGAELVRSAGRARAANRDSRRLLSDLHFEFGQGIKSDQTTFGEGKTSAVGWKTFYV